MNKVPLIKISPQSPAQLCRARGVTFDDPTITQMAAQSSSEEFLHWLVAQEHFVDAIRFLAHALPRREAVWWACTSSRRALGREPEPEDVAALEAADAWVRRPDDEHARAALNAAETAGMESASSLTAVAAFFSSGNISPPGMPAIPPEEHLTGTMVASAVLTAGSVGKPERAPERYRLLLQQGIDIAAGGKG